MRRATRLSANWRQSAFASLLSCYRGASRRWRCGGLSPINRTTAGSVIVDTAAVLDSASPAALEPLSDSLIVASQPYVGRWSRLVSTTNWEKGRIVVEWRETLIAQGLPVGEYSDEAWGQLVGGVTGQHVGRLRRVYARFGSSHDKYAGLFWSHFQAALEWSDAEMWLEGALQSGWSVAQMRDERWTTLGKVETDRPRVADVVASELDEDAEPSRRHSPSITGEYSEVSGPRHEGSDFGDEPGGASRSASAPGTDWMADAGSNPAVELVRPFENLPDLPDDLAEAFDAMKLAVLHHKRDGWQVIAAADVLRTLDALKALVTAPSDDAPF
jgi:hypothetical protein